MNKIAKYVLFALGSAVIVAGTRAAARTVTEKLLFSKPQEELLAEVSNMNGEKLIQLINTFEKNQPESESQTDLSPLYSALIDKADGFSEEQILSLLMQDDTRSGIESALVQMYLKDGYDSSKMLGMLEEAGVSDETKEYITGHCNFTEDELCNIFRKHDGGAAAAIKVLSSTDAETAEKLVNEFITSDQESISENDYMSLLSGIEQYYEANNTPEDLETMKSLYIPMIQYIMEQVGSENVQKQAVSVLGKTGDYDLFRWVIENQNIANDTKISVTEQNREQMQEWIENADSEDDIQAVMEAMQILPIPEIADVMQRVIDQGSLPESEQMQSVIDFIRKQGSDIIGLMD